MDKTLMLKNGQKIDFDIHQGLYKDLALRLSDLRESLAIDVTETKTYEGLMYEYEAFLKNYTIHAHEADKMFLEETGVTASIPDTINNLSDLIFNVEDVNKLFFWRLNGIDYDVSALNDSSISGKGRSRFLYRRLGNYFFHILVRKYGGLSRKALGNTLYERGIECQPMFLDETGVTYSNPASLLNGSVTVKNDTKLAAWKAE